MIYSTKSRWALQSEKLEQFVQECSKHTENSVDSLLNQIINCPLDFGVILFNTGNTVLSMHVNNHNNQLQIF